MLVLCVSGCAGGPGVGVARLPHLRAAGCPTAAARLQPPLHTGGDHGQVPQGRQTIHGQNRQTV